MMYYSMQNQKRGVISMTNFEINKTYIPKNIPEQIKFFDKKISQLDVGKSGKNGFLKAEFEVNSQGESIVRNLYTEMPLHVQKSLLSKDDSGLSFMYIMSSSGGIIQGDRYKMEITMKKNSQAHITTQGATRIYSMDSNWASMWSKITLEENSYLEYIPDQIIPYKDSKFFQQTELIVDETATAIYSEIVTPGRMAMNENFDFEICYLKTEINDKNGAKIILDISNMEPKKQEIKKFGIFGKYDILGSIYIVSNEKSILELESKISEVLKTNKKIFGGLAISNLNRGILVRILGVETTSVREIITEIVRIVRKKIINKDFYEIRKN